MARFWSAAVLVICAIIVVVSASLATVEGGGGEYLGWIPSKPACDGSIADCLAEEEEWELDSESNRRILATQKYISYGALQRNTVPCSRRGASYYNCQPGAQSNPYSRGCTAIARCRS
ncbi:Rapid ALkalinization Factor [Trema orientale]|uniref:Rapid ALkalinization Factor n=1 Tax=Trema orientale TaxID=63057 RepID=A0A2P5BTG1_TREOI|nr:Rapid ALkalinization Factor [Trema orientale]